MEIRVLGDFDFALNIIQGVTRLYVSGSPFVTYAPAIMISLFLLWATLKWALDQDRTPYPAKEFVFGLVFWLIFGGGELSPKFQVELVSERENRFQVIDEVPFLVAVPSWLASNFFGGAREELESSFSPIYYSLGDRTPDPLSALVKMYEHTNNAYISPDLNESIKTYMVECYHRQLLLDGTPISSLPKDVNNTPIYSGLWDSVKVDYNFITTTYFDELNPSGVITDCITAWSNINTIISNVGSDFNIKLVNYEASKGVTPPAIALAAEMIFTNSTTGTAPNPYSVMTGLFLSSAMRDGIAIDGTNLWADKMVFEAHRKRVFEKAGERNIFLMVMIPVITAIETFSFFIAPIMMLLSVMGGAGLKFMGKYLFLVLFVNLWGFVKIFTDLFTALSVEKAFATASIVDPFAFGAYPETFAEIEGLLATSANLTTSIPMLVMFLLYGGIHSVMGVMRGLTQGSVDGENMAPKLSSTMSGGHMSMGDRSASNVFGSNAWAQSQSNSTDHGLGDWSINSSVGNARSTSDQIVSSQSRNNAETYITSLSDAVTGTNTSSFMENGQFSKNINDLNSVERMAGITEGIAKKFGISQGEAFESLAKLQAQGDVGLNLSTPGAAPGSKGSAPAKFGFGAKLSGAISASGKEGSKISAEDMNSFLKQFSTQNKNSLSGSISYGAGDAWSIDERSQRADTSQQINQSTAQYNDALQRQSNTSRGLSEVASSNSNYSIRLPALSAVYQSMGENFQKMYDNLVLTNPERMQELGLPETASEFLRENGHNGSLVKALQSLDSTLVASSSGAGNIDTVQQQKDDLRLASQMWKSVADDVNRDDVSTGLRQVASGYSEMSSVLDSHLDAKTLANEGKNISPPDGVISAAELEVNRANLNAKTKANEQNVDAAVSGLDIATSTSLNGIKSQVGDLAVPESLQKVFAEGGTYQDLMKKFEDNKETMSTFVGGAGLATSAASGVSDFVSIFTGSNPVWGHDSETRADAFASLLNNQGNRSNVLDDGFEALSTMSTSEIKNLMSNGNIDPKAYAMNDVLMALPAIKDQIFSQIEDPEKATQFVRSLNDFANAKNALTEEQQTDMDVMSANRANGVLPNFVVDELIGNKAGDQIDDTWIGDKTSPAAYYLNEHPELLESESVKRLSGINDQKDLDNVDHQDSRSAFVNALNADTAEYLKSTGGYQFDGEKFIGGYNKEVSEDQILSSLTSLSNSAGEPSAFIDNLYSSSQVYGLTSNNGLETYVQRLEDAGLVSDAQEMMDHADLALTHATGEGVILNKADAQTNVNNFRDYVKDLDFSKLGESSYDRLPRENISDIKPVSTSSDPYKSHVVSEGSATGNDSRVGYHATAESVISADRMPNLYMRQNIATQSSEGAVQRKLESYEFYDQILNREFNEANSDGVLPLSFTLAHERMKVELQSVGEDGVATYSDGKGTFSYTPGDDRLMPVDHPHYIKQKTD